jgi:hypothetical protein
MARLIVVACALACACKHQMPAPPSPLQDGSPAPPADAEPIAAASDAAPAAEAATPTKIVAGLHAACAVMSDHSVRCWGKNDAGQLGDGTQKDSDAPVAPKLRGVADLVLGDDHACALLDDASVACWGKIGFGAKPGPTLTPTGVVGVHDMARVLAVGGASCATAQDGPLVCWGDVDARGHITQTGAHHAPTPVPGIDHVMLLAQRAAVRDDGSMMTWLDDRTPVRAEIAGATELASVADAACALDGNGDVRCVGSGAPCAAPAAPPPPPPPVKKKPRGHGPRRGGRPATPVAPPPPPAPPPEVPALPFHTKATHLAFGFGTCIVNAAKQVVCLDAQCAVGRPVLTNVVEVAGSCARLASGSVRCVGSDGIARTLDNIAGATALAASGTHACAIANGVIACGDATRP